jgi:hypothetical protein
MLLSEPTFRIFQLPSPLFCQSEKRFKPDKTRLIFNFFIHQNQGFVGRFARYLQHAGTDFVLP